MDGNSQKAAEISLTADDKTIRRKYVFKKIKLDVGSKPVFNKRSILVGVSALLLTAVGVLVVPKILSSGISRYKPDPGMTAKWTLDTLARATGRYRFHVGAYPTTEEGLEVLAYCQQDEVAKIRRAHPGWKGPYVGCIEKDPWGGKYVYEAQKDDEPPILYSCGPDRKAGTPDDIWPHQALFTEPSWDTSWTKCWVPVKHRGGVVAPMQRGATRASPGEGSPKKLPERQQPTVCEKTVQNDVRPNCASDGSEDFGDISDMMKIPLLVGIITFVVLWLLLRLIFPRRC